MEEVLRQLGEKEKENSLMKKYWKKIVCPDESTYMRANFTQKIIHHTHHSPSHCHHTTPWVTSYDFDARKDKTKHAFPIPNQSKTLLNLFLILAPIYADICRYILTYADICRYMPDIHRRYMPIYADICPIHAETYADICPRAHRWRTC